jgi:GNAT superfamily N-acetyltransferase
MTERRFSFTVRAATVSDAGTLATLRSAMFRELRNTPSPGDRAAFEALAASAFQAGLNNGTCLAWLAEATDRRPIGSVALLVFPRLPSPESLARQEGYLLNVYTTPDFRGRGIATALVAAAVAKARELHLGRIRLHATPEGQSVYAAAGFAARHDEMELRLAAR